MSAYFIGRAAIQQAGGDVLAAGMGNQKEGVPDHAFTVLVRLPGLETTTAWHTGRAYPGLITI
ncbi:MAG: hypothetical protein AAGH87_08355 [Pseudomonadota bacterium]